MATGTSKNFILTGGSWTHSSTNFTPIVDDTPSNASSGIIVNGKRQWEWDMYSNTTHSREVTGSGDKLKFEYGTTTSNGIWTITGSGSGSASPVNGIVTIGTYATFTQSDAFVGNVPTHTDGHGSTSGNTGTESVNLPYVTWAFPHRPCGATTYVSVTHTAAMSNATTYTVHDHTGQIGTIVVGTGATDSANFGFTISHRTITVKDSSGNPIATKMFTCSKKVSCNFW